MKKFLNPLWGALSSRAVYPVVLGIFLITYIVIAFGTEDALIALMGITASSVLLQLLLAVLPLSSASRLVLEVVNGVKRRRILSGGETTVPEALFDERAEVADSPAFEKIGELLAAEGYATRVADDRVSAWRGGGGSLARILFLAATFSLFAGILISVSTRSTSRANVIEGEPFPTATGGGGVTEQISLTPGTGSILAQRLVMKVGASQQGDPAKSFGLYPPSLYRGYFVYPRYLGIAPMIRISAPDMPQEYQAFHLVNVYPAGREDKADIPGTPYKIMLTLAEAGDHSDPFVTGRATVMFKLLKGKDVVLAGTAPMGGEPFVKDGYRIAFPNWRRTVQTDFVLDFGVPLIWGSGILFLLSLAVWLPSRFLFPRREMVFMRGGGRVAGFSRAEGERRRHGGVFHEVLDLVESRGTVAADAAAERSGI